MQRSSPIIPWLLGAATICVDLVAISWLRTSTPFSISLIVFFALLVGELSAVCIWSALRPRPVVWTQIAIILGVVACSIAFSLLSPLTNPTEAIPYFGLQAAVLFAVLWVFRRSSYWQRRSGIETSWSFSLAQLLAVTTVVAFLSFSMRRSDLLDLSDIGSLAFVLSSVALAVASVLIWSHLAHWLLRMAGVLAVAIFFGVVFYMADEYMMPYALAHFVVQALTLMPWLAWGEILRVRDDPWSACN